MIGFVVRINKIDKDLSTGGKRMTVQKSETFIRNLLAMAEVQVNGSNPWDIQVHDPRFYDRLVRDVQLGLGESYMDGWWDCEAIDQFITRALLARLDTKIKGSLKIAFLLLQSRLLNMQSRARAFEVGQKHYDLGNDLYCAMLDKRLNYTCAYWKDARNLDEAQEAKLHLVCRKIGLKPGKRVLEIGCACRITVKSRARMMPSFPLA